MNKCPLPMKFLKSIPESRTFQTRDGQKVVLKKWRDATVDDIKHIKTLETLETVQIFGDVDLDWAIRVSLYSILIETEKNELVAFMCLNPSPNIPALPTTAWLDWIRYYYRADTVTYENCIFIHYLAMNPVYDFHILDTGFTEIFLQMPKLRYIGCVVPPVTTRIYKRMFHTSARHIRPSFADSRISQTIFVYSRKNILPTLRVRKAVAEDNDEMMNILDKFWPDFRKNYGNFYIAEAIRKKDASRVILAAEINNKVVGMMWFSSSIKISQINRNFELAHCAGLRKTSHKIKPQHVDFLKIIKKESRTLLTALDYFHKEFSNMTLNDEEESEETFVNKKWEPSAPIKKEQLESDMNLTTDTEIESSLSTLPYVLTDWVEKENRIVNDMNRKNEILSYEPTFLTRSNVFTLELYAIDKNLLDMRMLFEIFKASFDAMEDKDYCVVSKSHAEPTPYFFKHFSQLAPRPKMCPPYVLYITHKAIILGHIEVNLIEDFDRGQIMREVQSMFDSNLPLDVDFVKQDILASIKKYFTTPISDEYILVVRCEGILVGIIITTSITLDVAILQRYYDLFGYAFPELVQKMFLLGQIKYAFINPLYEVVSPFIFRELHRICWYYLTIYIIDKKDFDNIYNNLTSEMVPIQPRRTYNLEVFSDFKMPKAFKGAKPEMFPLYFQNMRVARERKKTVDLRIVIIGCGDDIFAFMEKLFFSPDYKSVKFTNIVNFVHETTGSDWAWDKTEATYLNYLFFRIRGIENEQCLGLHQWIQIVTGQLKEINRARKVCCLMDNTIIPYDIIVLGGTEYNFFPKEIKSAEDYPKNFQAVNSTLDGYIFRNKIAILKKLYKDSYSIVVHGRCIEAYSCINFLLNEGVLGPNIYFVIPYFDKHEELEWRSLNDKNVFKIVVDKMREANVNIYDGYRMEDWKIDHGIIKYAIFISKYRCIRIYCTLFVSYMKTKIPPWEKKVLTNAEILHDYSIIIDQDFKTSDPNIYAMSVRTAYKRNLYAKSHFHGYYDPFAVGAYLADLILKEHKFLRKEEKRSEESLAVPIFSSRSLKARGYFPGNLYYSQVSSPGKRINFELTSGLKSFGADIITGSGKDFEECKGYFRIRLDRKDYITDIVTLAKQYFPTTFVNRMWGYHESTLRNLKKRCETGEIKDLYEYFLKKWMIPYTHDKFLRLEEQNTAMMIDNLKSYNKDLHKIIKDIFERKRSDFSDKDKENLLQILKKMDLSCARENLYKFMDSYELSFIVYAKPTEFRNAYIQE